MALPVKDFIIERLLEYDETFDVGGGIATTQLMINPLSVILQPLRDELDDVKANQSILSVLESSDPDGFDTDTVDALASNVFIERRDGTKSSGVVRIRYFSPQAVDIGTGLASFLDETGNRFLNVNPISITQSEMSLNVDGSLYYVDVPVEAEEEGENDVEDGGIQTFENEPANVANVTNLNDFSGGLAIETNTELIDRIKVAVTVRALVTGRGIITTMTDNFSTILEINPRGFGDPEMQRDIVFNTHVGGHADVWVKTPAVTEEEYDVVGIVVDTTRQTREKSSVIMEDASPTTYSLRHGNIDRTNFTPIVQSADKIVGYVEGVDYTLDDTLGEIERIALGNIYHDTGMTGASPAEGITTNKTLVDAAAPFLNVRPGMQLKITSGATQANYSIKTVSATTLTIYKEFQTADVGNGFVSWQIDDVVTAEYDYNPLAIDVIESVRSSARELFTITDVPLIRIRSIEVLDPSTGQPTGTFLDSTGGYGQGGFGVGAFGVGTAAEYILRIAEPNLRFSADEDNYIDISSSYTGFSLRVTYETSAEITTYQDYVEDVSNRVVTAKLIVKHFIPVFVNTATAITYRVSASNTSALSEAAMQTAVETFIETIPIKNNLELSDIVDLLYNNGANQVDLDFTLSGDIHNTDGEVTFINSDAQGILEIPDNVSALGYLPDIDNPISQEIAHFMAGTLTLTRIST